MWLLDAAKIAKKTVQEKAVSIVHTVQDEANAVLQSVQYFGNPAAQLFVEPTVDELLDYEEFQKNFNIGKKTDDIAQILSQDNDVAVLHADLVPVTLSYDEFWMRYYFRIEYVIRDANAGGRQVVPEIPRKEVLETIEEKPPNLPEFKENPSLQEGVEHLNILNQEKVVPPPHQEDPEVWKSRAIKLRQQLELMKQKQDETLQLSLASTRKELELENEEIQKKMQLLVDIARKDGYEKGFQESRNTLSNEEITSCIENIRCKLSSNLEEIEENSQQENISFLEKSLLSFIKSVLANEKKQQLQFQKEQKEHQEDPDRSSELKLKDMKEAMEYNEKQMEEYKANIQLLNDQLNDQEQYYKQENEIVKDNLQKILNEHQKQNEKEQKKEQERCQLLVQIEEKSHEIKDLNSKLEQKSKESYSTNLELTELREEKRKLESSIQEYQTQKNDSLNQENAEVNSLKESIKQLEIKSLEQQNSMSEELKQTQIKMQQLLQEQENFKSQQLVKEQKLIQENEQLRKQEEIQQIKFLKQQVLLDELQHLKEKNFIDLNEMTSELENSEETIKKLLSDLENLKDQQNNNQKHNESKDLVELDSIKKELQVSSSQIQDLLVVKKEFEEVVRELQSKLDQQEQLFQQEKFNLQEQYLKEISDKTCMLEEEKDNIAKLNSELEIQKLKTEKLKDFESIKVKLERSYESLNLEKQQHEETLKDLQVNFNDKEQFLLKEQEGIQKKHLKELSEKTLELEKDKEMISKLVSELNQLRQELLELKKNESLKNELELTLSQNQSLLKIKEELENTVKEMGMKLKEEQEKFAEELKKHNETTAEPLNEESIKKEAFDKGFLEGTNTSITATEEEIKLWKNRAMKMKILKEEAIKKHEETLDETKKHWECTLQKEQREYAEKMKILEESIEKARLEGYEKGMAEGKNQVNKLMELNKREKVDKEEDKEDNVETELSEIQKSRGEEDWGEWE